MRDPQKPPRQRIEPDVDQATIGDRAIVFDTPWMRVVSKRLPLRPAAAPESYFVVEVDDWTVVCPRMADGRIIMVQQYRPSVERDLLEFPAGMIDPGETAAASIERELLEETGHRARRLVPLGSYFADTGRLNSRAHLFYADVEAIQTSPPESGIICKTFTADEIDTMVRDGGICALHHVALWLLVQSTGLLVP
jgi:ADP-ribose pyrophosphatase